MTDAAAAKTFAVLHDRFPPSDPWPSGPGTACGKDVCKKGELCCEAGSDSKCMPKTSDRDCMQKGAPAFCDESSDCSGDDRCCQGLTDDGTLTKCVSQRRCAQYWDRPGGTMIPAREICARGGSCKTPGTMCVDAPNDSVSGGQCVSEKARVDCGTGTNCPDDKPWCYWNRDTRKGECIPRGAWWRQEGVFECDDASDCPGAMCCGGNDQSFCSVAECDPGLAYAAIICHSAKDCGKNEGNTPSCSPDPGLPTGLGTCSWSASDVH